MHSKMTRSKPMLYDLKAVLLVVLVHAVSLGGLALLWALDAI
jgi:hypothetical protein